jgi:hypothetical protein
MGYYMPEKKTKSIVKRKVGHPERINKEVQAKLEAAFALGATDREACAHAGVPLATLYAKQNRDIQFLERKQMLKEKPSLKARAVIMDAINRNDVRIAQWYLERVKKAEFGASVAVEGSVNFNLNARVDNIPKIRKLRAALFGAVEIEQDDTKEE